MIYPSELSRLILGHLEADPALAEPARTFVEHCPHLEEVVSFRRKHPNRRSNLKWRGRDLVHLTDEFSEFVDEMDEMMEELKVKDQGQPISGLSPFTWNDSDDPVALLRQVKTCLWALWDKLAELAPASIPPLPSEAILNALKLEAANPAAKNKHAARPGGVRIEVKPAPRGHPVKINQSQITLTRKHVRDSKDKRTPLSTKELEAAALRVRQELRGRPKGAHASSPVHRTITGSTPSKSGSSRSKPEPKPEAEPEAKLEAKPEAKLEPNPEPNRGSSSGQSMPSVSGLLASSNVESNGSIEIDQPASPNSRSSSSMLVVSETPEKSRRSKFKSKPPSRKVIQPTKVDALSNPLRRMGEVLTRGDDDVLNQFAAPVADLLNSGPNIKEALDVDIIDNLLNLLDDFEFQGPTSLNGKEKPRDSSGISSLNSREGVLKTPNKENVAQEGIQTLPPAPLEHQEAFHHSESDDPPGVNELAGNDTPAPSPNISPSQTPIPAPTPSTLPAPPQLSVPALAPAPLPSPSPAPPLAAGLTLAPVPSLASVISMAHVLSLAPSLASFSSLAPVLPLTPVTTLAPVTTSARVPSLTPVPSLASVQSLAPVMSLAPVTTLTSFRSLARAPSLAPPRSLIPSKPEETFQLDNNSVTVEYVELDSKPPATNVKSSIPTQTSELIITVVPNPLPRPSQVEVKPPEKKPSFAWKRFNSVIVGPNDIQVFDNTRKSIDPGNAPSGISRSGVNLKTSQSASWTISGSKLLNGKLSPGKALNEASAKCASVPTSQEPSPSPDPALPSSLPTSLAPPSPASEITAPPPPPRFTRKRHEPDFSHIVEAKRMRQAEKREVKPPLMPTSKTITRSKAKACVKEALINFRVTSSVLLAAESCFNDDFNYTGNPEGASTASILAHLARTRMEAAPPPHSLTADMCPREEILIFDAHTGKQIKFQGDDMSMFEVVEPTNDMVVEIDPDGNRTLQFEQPPSPSTGSIIRSATESLLHPEHEHALQDLPYKETKPPGATTQDVDPHHPIVVNQGLDIVAMSFSDAMNGSPLKVVLPASSALEKTPSPTKKKSPKKSPLKRHIRVAVTPQKPSTPMRLTPRKYDLSFSTPSKLTFQTPDKHGGTPSRRCLSNYITPYKSDGEGSLNSSVSIDTPTYKPPEASRHTPAKNAPQISGSPYFTPAKTKKSPNEAKADENVQDTPGLRFLIADVERFSSGASASEDSMSPSRFARKRERVLKSSKQRSARVRDGAATSIKGPDDARRNIELEIQDDTDSIGDQAPSPTRAPPGRTPMKKSLGQALSRDIVQKKLELLKQTPRTSSPLRTETRHLDFSDTELEIQQSDEKKKHGERRVLLAISKPSPFKTPEKSPSLTPKSSPVKLLKPVRQINFDIGPEQPSDPKTPDKSARRRSARLSPKPEAQSTTPTKRSPSPRKSPILVLQSPKKSKAPSQSGNSPRSAGKSSASPLRVLKTPEKKPLAQAKTPPEEPSPFKVPTGLPPRSPSRKRSLNTFASCSSSPKALASPVLSPSKRKPKRVPLMRVERSSPWKGQSSQSRWEKQHDVNNLDNYSQRSQKFLLDHSLISNSDGTPMTSPVSSSDVKAIQGQPSPMSTKETAQEALKSPRLDVNMEIVLQVQNSPKKSVNSTTSMVTESARDSVVWSALGLVPKTVMSGSHFSRKDADLPQLEATPTLTCLHVTEARHSNFTLEL